MAINLGKFNKQLFGNISASAADPADTNTLFKTKQRIPKVLKEANWFNQNKVDATRIVRQGTLFYVPISKQNFRSMTTDFIEANFNSTIAAQFSSSFNNKFTLASLPDDVIILGEDGPAATSSFTQDKVSGIDDFTVTFTNTSQNAGGATWSFSSAGPIGGIAIHQLEFTSSYQVKYQISASKGVGFSLTNNHNPFSQSGSKITGGLLTNINGTDDQAGTYFKCQVKGKIFGDGDETTFSASFDDPTSSLFIPTRETLIFDSTKTVVVSGSFFYKAGPHARTNARTAVSTGDLRTIYWPQSASKGTLPYSGSLIQSGTLFYSSSDLTVAADSGWYYPTQSMGFGVYNNTTDLLFAVDTGSGELVPRIFATDEVAQV